MERPLALWLAITLVAAGASAQQGHVLGRGVEVAWDTRIGAVATPPPAVPGVASDVELSPDGEQLYVGGSRSSAATGLGQAEVAALYARTGELLWCHRSPAATGVEELVATPDGAAVVVRSPGAVLALDALTGTELWLRPLGEPRDVVVSQAGDRVFVARALDNDTSVLALDAQTGATVWHRSFGGNRLGDDPGGVALAPDGDTLYVTGRATIKTGRSSKLRPLTVAFDAHTGLELWSVVHDLRPSFRGERVAASPAGDRLYVSLVRDPGVTAPIELGDVLALDAATGAEVWASGPLEVGLTTIALDPAGTRLVGGGTSLEGGVVTSRLVALDTADGAERWRIPFGTDAAAAVADVAVSADGTSVLAAGSTDALDPASSDIATHAYELADGRELWRARFNGPADHLDAAAALVASTADGRLFVAGTSADAPSLNDMVVLAYETPTLVSADWDVSLSAGGVVTLGARTSPAEAGRLYWIFGSATGTSPGIMLPGRVLLPLVDDAYLRMTLLPLQPPFEAFLGVLDGQGGGAGRLNVLPGSPPDLAGTTLFHSYIVIDPAPQITHVSNPLELRLDP